ncbi:MAG: Rieske 2Fe-2S domain-containing protein [Candidatus Nitrosocosmicus sp.]|nr:Rieske 2Fe-2S domain-containing protein [Candidatus Nitrosocosmicus sp.]MDN5867170.1 Rieske 2Fe-2S domain-containing protein [Candidatus Nitrosocosmicus sp.]
MTRFKIPLNKGELQEGKLKRIDVSDYSIVLTLINGKIYAMDTVCSHEGGPLEEGTLEGYNLICPWHQGIFDIRSAKASPKTDWVTDLNSYKVTVDENNGDIYIDTQ